VTSVVPVSEGLWSRAAAVLGAVVLALAPGVPAAADPTPGQVESQINDAWNALEPIVEQYDRVHAQLLATQARIDALRRRIQPLQMQVDLATARVGAMSARLYETGPGSRLAALLNSGSADTVVDQMTTLDELRHLSARTVEVAFRGTPPALDGCTKMYRCPPAPTLISRETSRTPSRFSLSTAPIKSGTRREMW